MPERWVWKEGGLVRGEKVYFFKLHSGTGGQREWTAAHGGIWNLNQVSRGGRPLPILSEWIPLHTKLFPGHQRSVDKQKATPGAQTVQISQEEPRFYVQGMLFSSKNISVSKPPLALRGNKTRPRCYCPKGEDGFKLIKESRNPWMHPGWPTGQRGW